MAQPLYIGLDLGGTQLKAALLDADLNVRARGSTNTRAEDGVDAVIEQLAETARALAAAANVTLADIRAVGVGAPGPIDFDAGVIQGAPNLPGWTRVPLRDRLSHALGRPVLLENDANAAAFGEWALGHRRSTDRRGRPVRDLVLMTLGTGVGGGIVLGNLLWRGAFGSAAELGHMIVFPDGELCGCGQRGCLEAYAAAASIAGRYENVTGRQTSAVEIQQRLSSDANAGAVWDDATRALGIACANLQHVLNPQLILLGGGLANAGRALLDPVRAHFETHSWRLADDHPEIALATLGNDAGMLGAAALAAGFDKPVNAE